MAWSEAAREAAAEARRHQKSLLYKNPGAGVRSKGLTRKEMAARLREGRKSAKGYAYRTANVQQRAALARIFAGHNVSNHVNYYVKQLKVGK